MIKATCGLSLYASTKVKRVPYSRDKFINMWIKLLTKIQKKAKTMLEI